jgi:hypothetical protein
MYFSVPLWSRFWIPLISGIQRAEQIVGFPSVLLDLSINHVVVFIAETPRPQRIAEIIPTTSANLRILSRLAPMSLIGTSSVGRSLR